MRRFDKLKNIHAANLLVEQRYLVSKGLLKENQNPEPIGKFGDYDLYYENKKFVILNGDINRHQLKYIVYELKNNKYMFVYHTNLFDDALAFVGPKKSNWTTEILPKIKETLAKIDAPTEWKNTIIKCEKLAHSARNASSRGVSQESIYQEIGSKWTELMGHTGNPLVGGDSNDKTKEVYWNQYCELRGLHKSLDFGDTMS